MLVRDRHDCAAELNVNPREPAQRLEKPTKWWERPPKNMPALLRATPRPLHGGAAQAKALREARRKLSWALPAAHNGHEVPLVADLVAAALHN